jgi:hypothetical protein
MQQTEAPIQLSSMKTKAAIYHLMQFQLVISLYLMAHIRDILSGNVRIDAIQLADFFKRKQRCRQKQQQ